jgi:hypothetical protein
MIPAIILSVLIIFTTSCPTYTPPSKPEDGPPVSRIDELFETEVVEGERKKTKFTTNNPEHWKPEGMTIWTTRGEPEETFESRTVLLSKSTGFYGGGYGMVFCQGLYEIEGTTLPAMLVVMINNNQQYIIGKAVGGIFYDYDWWKTTTHLNRGEGSENIITVDHIDGSYSLKINGFLVESFYDNEYPQLRGGKDGYIAVITPFDSFPVPGLDILFEED